MGSRQTGRQVTVEQPGDVAPVGDEEHQVPAQHVGHADEEAGPQQEEQEGQQQQPAEEGQVEAEGGRGEEGDGHAQIGQLEQRVLSVLPVVARPHLPSRHPLPSAPFSYPVLQGGRPEGLADVGGGGGEGEGQAAVRVVAAAGSRMEWVRVRVAQQSQEVGGGRVGGGTSRYAQQRRRVGHDEGEEGEMPLGDSPPHSICSTFFTSFPFE